MEEAVIRSAGSGASLTLSARNDLYFDVRFRSADISFGRTVYGHSDQEALVRLFDRMAASWKGWPGTMEWASLEGEMELRCTHDGLGHIDLELSLIARGGQAEWWKATAHLVVDAGQLDRMAYDVRRFFS